MLCNPFIQQFGANHFTFIGKGSTPYFANKKDGRNIIAFQPLGVPGSGTIARTYYLAYEFWPIFNRDRLKEVDTIINTNYYWATGPSASNYLGNRRTHR